MQDYPESEHESPDLPSPQRVADRALAVASVHLRALVEDTGKPRRLEWLVWPILKRYRARWMGREFRQRVVPWLKEEGVWDELEPWERGVIEAPMGSLGEEAQVTANAYWLGAGLDVLAWALNRSGLTPFHSQEAPLEVVERVGLLHPRSGSVLAEPTLRPVAEVEALEDRLLAIHWRLVEYRLRREPLDLRTVPARMFGFLKQEVVESLEMAEGDLAIRGVPIARAPLDLVRACESVVMERRKAAKWLMGLAPTYSDVPVDT